MKYLLLLILPSLVFSEILDCKIRNASMLQQDGTIGKHQFFNVESQLESQKNFSFDTTTGKISKGTILQNDQAFPPCSVEVSGGGDNDTTITSKCGSAVVEFIKIATYQKNKPFVAIDFLSGIYSGICKSN